MSDNLLLYKYFMVAADEKSITGAARRLYVSQPAVSSGIAKLEDSLGVSLFFRNNKGISLYLLPLTPMKCEFAKAFRHN